MQPSDGSADAYVLTFVSRRKCPFDDANRIAALVPALLLHAQVWNARSRASASARSSSRPRMTSPRRDDPQHTVFRELGHERGGIVVVPRRSNAVYQRSNLAPACRLEQSIALPRGCSRLTLRADTTFRAGKCGLPNRLRATGQCGAADRRDRAQGGARGELVRAFQASWNCAEPRR